MALHEYKAILSEEERTRYIEETQGESFAKRYKSTALFATTYEEVMAQVEELVDYETRFGKEENEGLSYPTSFFTQVPHLNWFYASSFVTFEGHDCLIIIIMRK